MTAKRGRKALNADPKEGSSLNFAFGEAINHSEP